MGIPLEARERLQSGKDSIFNLSVVQGVRHAGGPQRVEVVARLAHMRRFTTYVEPGVPTLLIMRWSLGAVAERERSG